MKMIVAVIKPSRLDAVLDAVTEAGASGLTVTEVDKDEFKNAVLKNVNLESLGYRKGDYDKIQAIKTGQGS